LVPYEKLQYEIAEVDLNLIPLLKSNFTNCKSELKYFEAAIVNVPSVATDTYIYKEIIIDGHNGFLVEDLNWYSKLEYIYLNRSTLLDSIKENGYQYAVNNYTVKNQVTALKKTYESIFNFYKNEL
jgi:glycosyltransferase involved in cell wall biosynthesis